jgi:hypothetical protein
MRIKPLQPTPYSLRVRCGFQARLRAGVTRGSLLAARGDEEVSMSFTSEDIIRPEVGFLLRGDYRGKFLCLPCLVTLIRERLGTNLSTSKIERAALPRTQAGRGDDGGERVVHRLRTDWHPVDGGDEDRKQ